VSTASLICRLVSDPASGDVNGREILESRAQTAGPEPCSILLRTIAGSRTAALHTTFQEGAYLIASGDLILLENQPILYCTILCHATDDQYLNEVTLVGRIAGDPKVTESGKSVSRSIAVNRYVNKQEETDWFKVRGYGDFMISKLTDIHKGSLVSAIGCLEQRTNREKQAYCEVKLRSIRVHKSKKDSSDPGANVAAAGYSRDDFTGMNNMPHDWN
jgi:single-stranded DNA-binding protein